MSIFTRAASYVSGLFKSGSNADPLADTRLFKSERAAYFQEMKAQAVGFASYSNVYLDGEKFPGGFGETKLFTPDYWTMRMRSRQLFHDNLYARGLIRRLITNELNTGLSPEAIPNPRIVGVDEDWLSLWGDDVEERFSAWAQNPKLCDYYGEMTFGQIQRQIRMESLIEGDILAILHVDETLGLPKIQIVTGTMVSSPLGGDIPTGHKVTHGVETDKTGKRVAYWVKDGLTWKRVPVYGDNSGRKMAFMIYGTERLSDHVRGMPMLSLIMQSMKELDRYRDAELRAAVINSMLAMWVEKAEEKPGTRPFTGGALRKDQIDYTTGGTTTESRSFTMAAQIPGAVIDEMQVGEKPHSFDTSRPNVNFGAFEAAIAQALAWANEVPPEIYMLSFNSNYSASRAAGIEFNFYLNRIRDQFSDEFCQPVWEQFLLGEILTRRIQAPGMLDAWRDPVKYHIYGSWISCDWSGAVKPHIDPMKEVKAYQEMVASGLITNERASKELTGTKFGGNMRRLMREEQLKTELMISKLRPILELEKEYGADAVSSAMSKAGISKEDVAAASDIADNVISFLDMRLDK